MAPLRKPQNGVDGPAVGSRGVFLSLFPCTRRSSAGSLRAPGAGTAALLRPGKGVGEKEAGAFLPFDLGGDVYRQGLATVGWLRLPSCHWVRWPSPCPARTRLVSVPCLSWVSEHVWCLLLHPFVTTRAHRGSLISHIHFSWQCRLGGRALV